MIFQVKAKSIINATGPFTDSIRKMDNVESESICSPSTGVHIVLPGYFRYIPPHIVQTVLFSTKFTFLLFNDMDQII